MKAQDDDNNKDSNGNPSPTTDLYTELDPQLRSVDFTQRVAWGKYAPYTSTPLPLHPPGTSNHSTNQLLQTTVQATCGRARALSLYLQAQPGQQAPPRPIPTPMFMPVGTKACLKGITFDELIHDLQCPIILANTYHLAIQPGTELIRDMGGLHSFQARGASYNLLTDSGGFQMVSLVKLSQVTEEGVSFENPYQAGERMLLRPEDSMQHQQNIGANIIMALDDVVSSVATDPARFVTATHRTLRWYDRCYHHLYGADNGQPTSRQNLFPIVQGGLDTNIGGLREISLAGFRHRDREAGYKIQGYAIGGLAGGESKSAFWRVVDQCCKALPDDKPRYLMGVGYPLDLVVCSALGVDMYDCVYPTRTARFGVALVPTGTLRLKQHEYSKDTAVLDTECTCQACQTGYTRQRLQQLFKAGNPVSVQLLTLHNITYMMRLVREMREAILQDSYPDYCRSFVQRHYPNRNDIPEWVVEALAEAGISL